MHRGLARKLEVEFLQDLTEWLSFTLTDFELSSTSKICEEIRGCCEKRTMLNMTKISSVFLTYLIILTANSLLLPVAGG